MGKPGLRMGHAKGRLVQLTWAMKTSLNLGFTLIELLIALSIFAFLIFIAGPMYGDFMGNTQIRNGAESALAGVRLAQTEALRGNTQAQFVIDPSTGGGWQVLRLNDETENFDLVQSYKWVDGASKTSVTVNPSTGTEVTFSGLGRVIDNPDASPRIKWIEVTNNNISTPRYLHVVVDPLTPTGVKLCDPAVTDTSDPRICPAN
jgi:type IV fimbrial biogenesis protein FimT